MTADRKRCQGRIANSILGQGRRCESAPVYLVAMKAYKNSPITSRCQICWAYQCQKEKFECIEIKNYRIKKPVDSTASCA